VSEVRTLLVTERRIAPERRAHQIEVLAARRAQCAAAGAQFWAFEHETEAGRYLEFVESRDATVLDALAQNDAGSSRWRSVEIG
jgi:hypothetical protein